MHEFGDVYDGDGGVVFPESMHTILHAAMGNRVVQVEEHGVMLSDSDGDDEDIIAVRHDEDIIAVRHMN